MRMKIDIESMTKEDWFEFVELCGWVLARAHARTGDPAQIAGYLGKTDAFDAAIEKFAVSYADQTERDHAAFLKAIRAGRIRARSTTSA
jgi:NAD(P)H-dependent flavin oxidoreductase YrpB (nitropropane dioxygenase family)